MKKILILLVILTSMFYTVGCSSKEKTGKISITVLDEFENEVTDLEVILYGVGESSYPYTFEDLKGYQLYTFTIEGINTKKYEKIGHKHVEAVENGTNLVIRLEPIANITEE
ncbi:MAG: hypothetical protein GX287_01160 [Fusobacteria bacterium]|nr:hypothetical protein [Fusobacteriota bacterium]